MKTFKELKEIKSSTILEDWYDESVRCLIMRGPAALCAYLGIPIDHPLAGFEYDLLNVDCHGGLTFAAEGDGTIRPDGFYWYGWDYGHAGDMSFYDLDYDFGNTNDKQWTVEDVKKDMWSAIYDFKRLIKLAEQIKNKGTINTH